MLFKFIDLFAGIGGFRLAFERQGFKCVFSSEYDPETNVQWNQIAYKELYGEYPKGDIREIDEKEVPDHDILCAGFPCQPFSSAGTGKGFQDPRGTLFFEIARIAQEKQPRFLVLENVTGLLSHNKGKTFTQILSTLDEIGYDAEWEVLNSKDFGVPQNRERVFIIGHIRTKSFRPIFPLRRKSKGNHIKRKSRNTDVKVVKYSSKYGLGEERNTALCLSASDWRGLHRNQWQNAVIELRPKIRIRKLTPLERFRLQGFPDEYYYKLKKLDISDTQFYKMTGNAVTVDVAEAIAKKIKELYLTEVS